MPELLDSVAEWRASGLTVGFTCGAFDLLHAGHVDYLDRAHAECDRLIIAVNSDASIRFYKNPNRPIVCEAHRLQLVAALRSADRVILMTDRRPTYLIEQIKPNLYIKGGDYKVEELRSAPLVESYGGRCLVIPVTHEISTTALLEKIEQLSFYAAPPNAPARNSKGIVFLDRDGTLIENVPFLRDPARVELLPGVAEGLRLLQDEGFLLVIVTNQQGLGLGYFTYNDFVAVNSEMLRQLSVSGVRISRIYHCPHSLGDSCDCRKPGTRLLTDALSYFGTPADKCYLIGDSASDMLAARNAGCHGLLVGPIESQATFRDAVAYILEQSSTSNMLEEKVV